MRWDEDQIAEHLAKHGVPSGMTRVDTSAPPFALPPDLFRMKNPLSTPTTRLNQILLQAAVRAEQVNAERVAERLRRENAQRLDREADQ